MTEEREMLQLERYLSEFDLSEWEKDILIEFNNSKPLDEMTEHVDKDYLDKFFINLADGIKQYKHDHIIEPCINRCVEFVFKKK